MTVVLSPGIARAAAPSTGRWYILGNTATFYYAAVAGGSHANGAKVIQWSGPYIPGGDGYRTEQQWQVYDPDGDEWFFLINAESQKVMGVSGGATANSSKIIQWDRNNSNTDQQWTFVNPGTTGHSNVPVSNYNYLLNRKSGRCLAVAGGTDGTDVEGQQLIIFDCHNRDIPVDDRIWYTFRTV
ncbi:RICIN domain-containing protein [Actinoplanes sp. NPDC049668]|uniref:RICIN domain-containing protein n=1 Tax=unclassified Actinoplanes TaxID=2626549 RepID=UPI0033A5FFE6